MHPKYILRIDDVTPYMNWDYFYDLYQFLESYDIKPLLGIVPDCKDESLHRSSFNKDFFEFIRSNPCDVAQHGTHHVYTTSDSGILKINNRSEFAGLDYKSQYFLIAKGKKILDSEDIWMPYFMPPSHSFDNITLDVLADLGFKAVTDGYGFYPYFRNNIMLVPQLLSKGVRFPLGVSTICLHLDYLSEKELLNLKSFIIQNHQKFISFSEYVENDALSHLSIFSAPLRKATEYIFRLKRLV